MCKRYIISIICSLLFITLISSCDNDSSVNSNTPSHTVTGRVVDENGEGSPSVTITLTGAEKQYTVSTSANGIYTIESVAEGLYLVSCEKDGFIFSIPNSEITVDGVITIPNIIAKAISIIPTPADGETDVVRTTLSWVVENLPASDITYDIKFGTNEESLSLIATNSSDSIFIPEKIEVSTSYYWQVILNFDNKTFESPIWHFTTCNPISIEMVSIPTGTFNMGSNFEDDSDNPNKGKGYYEDERPIHNVTLTSFEMSITEVTQSLYLYVMGINPSDTHGIGDNYPVYRVSWYDAAKFCNLLSDEAGYERCYDENTWECDFSRNGFRLPTEAEWEYVCRAGTDTEYYTGDDQSDLDHAGWYEEAEAMPVGQKEPNTWGLYDMHGNVWEWCHDWYDKYSSETLKDPIGPSIGTQRIMRGGSWNNFAIVCRSALRGRSDPSKNPPLVGFRVVRRP